MLLVVLLCASEDVSQCTSFTHTFMGVLAAKKVPNLGCIVKVVIAII